MTGYIPDHPQEGLQVAEEAYKHSHQTEKLASHFVTFLITGLLNSFKIFFQPGQTIFISGSIKQFDGLKDAKFCAFRSHSL